MNKEYILKEILKHTDKNNTPLTKKEFIKQSGISDHYLQKYGGYLKLLEELNLNHPNFIDKEKCLNNLKEYIHKVGYVPKQKEIYTNGVMCQYVIEKLGGYKKILKEIGYEYPKWRAEDFTKEEMKNSFLKIYDKAPTIKQVEEDYQSGNLPFSMFVIRRKFGTLNGFVKYCGLEFNERKIYYYDNEEIKNMFLELYDIDSPPTQQQIDIDYKNGEFEFSADMLYKKFGSYNQFLEFCGCKTFNGLFSEPCIAKDGHICDSKTEKYIDDFLYENNINHKIHVYYKDIIPNFHKNNKVDWVLEDGTVVEYFGLMGNKIYEQKVKEKIKILNKNKINYIAIYPNDLERLDFLFSPYLNKEAI